MERRAGGRAVPGDEAVIAMAAVGVMAMREQPKDSLRPWLREWAQWHRGSKRQGFSDTTTLYRAVRGERSAKPTSSIPHGAVPPAYMEPLIHAMRELMDDHRTCYAVSIMRDFYLDGPEGVVQNRKIGRRQVYEIRDQGEAMLRAWMCARGY